MNLTKSKDSFFRNKEYYIIRLECEKLASYPLFFSGNIPKSVSFPSHSRMHFHFKLISSSITIVPRRTTATRISRDDHGLAPRDVNVLFACDKRETSRGLHVYVCAPMRNYARIPSLFRASAQPLHVYPVSLSRTVQQLHRELRADAEIRVYVHIHTYTQPRCREPRCMYRHYVLQPRDIALREQAVHCSHSRRLINYRCAIILDSQRRCNGLRGIITALTEPSVTN